MSLIHLSDTYPFCCSSCTAFCLSQFQVREVFDDIAPMVGLSVGSAVGQSSIADEVSSLVPKPKQEFYPTIDEEYVQMEPQTKIDILVATPERLMDHINMTNGFSLEHLQYLVGLWNFVT
jgi:ATP-dependent RNA helicase DDX51/DBP6